MNKKPTHYTLGIFPGEGIGPDLSDAAISTLDALQKKNNCNKLFEIKIGGEIGNQSIEKNGNSLDIDAINFCHSIFDSSGAILAGPGGDRFVYECRDKFDLYYKLNPISPCLVSLGSRKVSKENLIGVDILIIRENSGGIYQGKWSSDINSSGLRSASQVFEYNESQIQRIAEIACKKSRARSKKLAVIVKPNGIPSVSNLWIDVVSKTANLYKVTLECLEIDYAAFALIQHPEKFDVILTSNLFGDVLSDIGGVLLGSRGLCYGASFSETGNAIYQTNHGAAYDLQGKNLANPVGHLMALAMMLEMSYKEDTLASQLKDAIRTTWSQGWRSKDLEEVNCKTLGTKEFTNKIIDNILTS